MKVYLAHNFAARDYLREKVKPFYEQAGHQVTSRWIEDSTTFYDPLKDAVQDLEDIDKADDLVFFQENFGNRPGKGKFVELGYAIRGGKRIILIGEDNGCVFNNLPHIKRVKTIEDSLKFL